MVDGPAEKSLSGNRRTNQKTMHFHLLMSLRSHNIIYLLLCVPKKIAYLFTSMKKHDYYRLTGEYNTHSRSYLKLLYMRDEV